MFSIKECYDFQFEFSQNPILSILRPGFITSQDANTILQRFKFTSKGCQKMAHAAAEVVFGAHLLPLP